MKFMSPRDIALILGVTVAFHILLRPLYQRLDG
jgi:hypothetical protein